MGTRRVISDDNASVNDLAMATELLLISCIVGDVFACTTDCKYRLSRELLRNIISILY